MLRFIPSEKHLFVNFVIRQKSLNSHYVTGKIKKQTDRQNTTYFPSLSQILANVKKKRKMVIPLIVSVFQHISLHAKPAAYSTRRTSICNTQLSRFIFFEGGKKCTYKKFPSNMLHTCK